MLVKSSHESLKFTKAFEQLPPILVPKAIICVLKMDHHCPWINNCVGHLNHRYFISFCVYMCLGTLYVAVSSWSSFIDHFYHGDENHEDKKSKLFKHLKFSSSTLEIADRILAKQTDINTLGNYISSHDYQHSSIIFVFMLSSAVTLALGLLTCWHLRLVTYGETSIELHINKKKTRELKRKRLVYRNPYNYGAWQNWRMVLGLVNGRSWMCILFPSSHPPYGSGLTWLNPPDDQEGMQGVLPV